MKIKVIKIIIYFLVFVPLFTPKVAHADNGLSIDWGVPETFSVSNMLPGDISEKDISITNTSLLAKIIAIKGEKVEEEKNFSEILDIEITRNSDFIYGGPSKPKKLKDFFNDSLGLNGIVLFPLNPSETATFHVLIRFPLESGNEYQNARVVFNLILGIEKGDNLVINEVFYDVDKNHGFDSPKDRGIEVNGNNVKISIEGNQEGSVNTVEVSIYDFCSIAQKNKLDIRDSTLLFANAGSNNALGNTNSNLSISTGFSKIFFNFVNFLGVNYGSCSSKKLGLNHEWIEIYNPTSFEISFKNWKLIDNSGIEIKINSNKKIPPKGYALISKDSSTWSYWNEDKNAVKIYLGSNIGDGLGDEGDRLYLKDDFGNVIDFVSWGNDSEIWNPAVADVNEGHSIERIYPGFDTNYPSDWEEEFPPTPGFN